MKIDKVVFSSSVEYSSFWNMQAKLYRAMGIEPVCLLFGKKSETQMSEQHGKVIEIEALPDLPWTVQMTWAKFHHPLTEPDATWLIGDMDLVPLQKHHFTDALTHVPAESMVHLNAAGISMPRLGILDGFRRCGCQRRAKDHGQNTGGADLPAHYFAAKGRNYKVFTLDQSLAEQVRHMVTSKRYGLGPMGDTSIKEDNAYWYYWCAEEHYSSELLQTAIELGLIEFHPLYYNNRNDTQRIDRTGWDAATKRYLYTPDNLRRKQFVDIHCARPYSEQEQALAEIVYGSGMLE